MNIYGYFNTHGYLYSGYPRGHGTDTGIKFIQRDGDKYNNTIRTYEYPLTFLGYHREHSFAITHYDKPN